MTVWLYVILSVSDCAQQCHILVSWSPDAWWLWELCQTDCVAVSDCVSLPTHVCLGPKGHLAPFLGWLAGLEVTSGQNWAGLEVRRAVPILPHPASPGRQANGKNVHTRGRQVAATPGTALCTENKFFWYQLEFGRKWLLGGRKLDSAHISPGRGAGEQLSGVKQSNREAGPPHPIPDRSEGTAHPSWSFGMIGGEAL